MTEAVPDSRIACHECDLLMQRPEIHGDQVVHCPRCGSRLISSHPNSAERSLALALAGLILLVPANLFPVLTLEVLGREQQQTIFSSAMALYQDGLALVALAVLLFAIMVPLLKLVLLAYVAGALHLQTPWPGLSLAMRSYQHLDQWGMLEVYLIAVLVSVVKLVDIATVHPGLGLYSLSALIAVTTLSSSQLDPDLFWHQIDDLNKSSLVQETFDE
ncbi:Paraquat-inducible protein A [Marinobacterium lacunae]|uniref:Paraquat-inducible protein A n=1 Tax=Marinobacterium lacunae TaxID=1232683 RepID=A0A081G1V7_9GAMM|nr:paraquat-inducible protein A [Marinobacterium lacunae]KEA64762.1 Paraquat-inducible protein A [Marinobacterium lacunae]MBR9883265.1 paraquat-inducible protein A [Oceanospirillales bacterium]